MAIQKYDSVVTATSTSQRLARSYQIDQLDRIYQRLDGLAQPQFLVNTNKDIQHYLAQYGISFEGRNLPISLTPTVVPFGEIHGIAQASKLIRNVLNRMLNQFIEEHKQKHFDGPFHRFFTPYYKWWDLIAREYRKSEHIQLMRYDAVRDNHGRWSFVETNTACPGGTIHCARIRDAWLSTKLGYELTKRERISSFSIDDPTAFVQFMHHKALEIDAEHPNIAILNYKGVYSNELVSLQKCHQDLSTRSIFENGELLLGDVRNITCHDGKAYLNGKPLALIYNKIDQLQIDPHDPEIQGWIQASECKGTEFLNSLGSSYLAETKRTLAMLSDPKWSFHLDLSPDEDAAIKDVIPFTRLIEDCVNENMAIEPLPARKKDIFVLKADALTRGSGVTIGDQVTQEEWRHALKSARENQGIAQLKCDLPMRSGFHVDANGEVGNISEYFGIDVFLFADQFAGLVSRSHVNQIFNVGNGGREAPVLVVGGEQ